VHAAKTNETNGTRQTDHMSPLRRFGNGSESDDDRRPCVAGAKEMPEMRRHGHLHGRGQMSKYQIQLPAALIEQLKDRGKVRPQVVRFTERYLDMLRGGYVELNDAFDRLEIEKLLGAFSRVRIPVNVFLNPFPEMLERIDADPGGHRRLERLGILGQPAVDLWRRLDEMTVPMTLALADMIENMPSDEE